MSRTILRLQEISDRTGIPVATLRWYRHKGQGGPQTWLLGRHVVAYADEVDRWVEAQRVATAVGGVGAA